MKAISSVAILLINGFLSLGLVRQQDSIAFVTQVEGIVKVERSGKLERITHTKFLREGDIVKIGAGGRAWVYQAYMQAEMLTPNSSKTIKRRPPATGPGLIDADYYAELAAKASDALQNIYRRSPSRMGGPDELTVTALAPRKSLLLVERPTFEWTPVKDAKSYEFAIYDSKQENPIWRTTTKEPRVAYPVPRNDDSIKPLLPGTYKWEVIADVDQNHRVYDATEFTVASEWQTTAARYALKIARKSVKNKNANNLFYVNACLDLRLYPEAEAELKQALRRTPDDLVLWALLMQVYEHMERYEERNELLDKLKDSKQADLVRILRGETPPTKK